MIKIIDDYINNVDSIIDKHNNERREGVNSSDDKVDYNYWTNVFESALNFDIDEYNLLSQKLKDGGGGDGDKRWAEE